MAKEVESRPMAAAPRSKVLSFMAVSLWRYGVPGGIAQLRTMTSSNGYSLRIQRILQAGQGFACLDQVRREDSNEETAVFRCGNRRRRGQRCGYGIPDAGHRAVGKSQLAHDLVVPQFARHPVRGGQA